MTANLSLPATRLVGDIGGTNARFALQTAQGLSDIRVLPTADYARFADALLAYLAATGATAVRHVAIGIANPVYGDQIRMTNHHWAFSIAQTRAELGLETFLVLNDFAVLARALPELPAAELVQVGGGSAVPGAPLALLGAGTGLGVSGLIPDGQGGWTPLAGEGGHVSFAPFDEREVAIWRLAHARFGHVSAERLLSGAGMAFLHQALGQIAGQTPPERSAAEITRLALGGSDALCHDTVTLFCTLLGTVAADLAITLGARGGVYIGGGIVPRLGDFFRHCPFRQRFEDKGRTSPYLRDIPVWVIHSPWPALLGAAAALDQFLQSH
ncbi:glucokinase [Thiomonas arsenitoxydans]|jgi:glucokinase|uniref:glucokinase n=1 Tax=Thiomonas arsenitoxydans (strain DSM 22701 / CIP 110005 / 3As) TaxID=426114 RepID=UPI001AC1C5BB|nr:glucokinase [Thiomonas arsenitoxydans]MBN8776201.1 glucokinase [Thiomonas arsenitoxydans]